MTRVVYGETGVVYGETLDAVLASGRGGARAVDRRGNPRHAATAPVTATTAATHALRVSPATKASVA
ncbi:hypothetical protein, partial [Streptomyces sp. NPDC004658]|uniref:hypothetical protein n=1 Tax=Streptomyces sp. NPDC004658 TaxID=3154672 RepID=UPI0033B43F26